MKVARAGRRGDHARKNGSEDPQLQKRCNEAHQNHKRESSAAAMVNPFACGRGLLWGEETSQFQTNIRKRPR